MAAGRPRIFYIHADEHIVNPGPEHERQQKHFAATRDLLEVAGVQVDEVPQEHIADSAAYGRVMDGSRDRTIQDDLVVVDLGEESDLVGAVIRETQALRVGRPTLYLTQRGNRRDASATYTYKIENFAADEAAEHRAAQASEPPVYFARYENPAEAAGAILITMALGHLPIN